MVYAKIEAGPAKGRPLKVFMRKASGRLYTTARTACYSAHEGVIVTPVLES